MLNDDDAEIRWTSLDPIQADGSDPPSKIIDTILIEEIETLFPRIIITF